MLSIDVTGTTLTHKISQQTQITNVGKIKYYKYINQSFKYCY